MALRTWLTKQHLTFPGPNGGGGQVTILPEDNATTLTAFEVRHHRRGVGAGALGHPDGLRGHGHVLVNEKTQWPQGPVLHHRAGGQQRTSSQATPTVVTDLLKGQIATNAYLNASPAKAQAAANAALATLTGKPLTAPELAAAWSDLTFTNDPIASSIATDVTHAKAVGFPSSSIAGIYDLGPLNSLLKAAGKAPVAS